MNYGLPYAGSKNQFANKILEVLPSADTFVDLFAGGCSMTHAAMLSGKYNHFIANDINPQIVQLFNDAIYGKYNDEVRWISHDDWIRLKDTDAYVKYCWSFSNNGYTYKYSKEIEPYEKALHYAVFWGDFAQLKDLCPEVADYCEEILHGITNSKQRRIKIKCAIVKRLKEIGDYGLIMSNPLYKSCSWKKPGKTEIEPKISSMKNMQTMTSLERLQSLERMQRPGMLPILERLEISSIDYQSVSLPDNAVVYCDIPYNVDSLLKNGLYGGGFDFDRYYDWVRSQDIVIYTSEYTMPDDFVTIWAYFKRSTFQSQKNKYVTEKLFVHESQLHKIHSIDLFGYDI